jgi:hypothetical protein
VTLFPLGIPRHQDPRNQGNRFSIVLRLLTRSVSLFLLFQALGKTVDEKITLTPRKQETEGTEETGDGPHERSEKTEGR